MTREDEIKLNARWRADQYDHPAKWSDTYYGFISGAEWADKTMIEKACKWLKDYAHTFVSETTGDLNEDDLINEFRKEMKGGGE